jgi:hypothetical protein
MKTIEIHWPEKGWNPLNFTFTGAPPSIVYVPHPLSSACPECPKGEDVEGYGIRFDKPSDLMVKFEFYQFRSESHASTVYQLVGRQSP